MSGSQLQYWMKVGPNWRGILKVVGSFPSKIFFLAKLKFHIYISFDARVENVDHAMFTAGAYWGLPGGTEYHSDM